MTKLSYGEQLKHPNWQRMRLQVLERAKWKCEHCSSEDQTLHVHHKRYIKGRLAWEYEPTNLLALCELCHAEHHEERERLNLLVAALPASKLSEAVSLLVGWCHLDLDVDIMVECSTDPYAENVGVTARGIERAKLNIYTVADLGCCFGHPEFDERLRSLVAELKDKAIGFDEARDA